MPDLYTVSLWTHKNSNLKRQLEIFFFAPSAPLSYTLSFPAITHFWSCWVFWTPRKSVSVAEKYSESSLDTPDTVSQARGKIAKYPMHTIGAERWQIFINLFCAAKRKQRLTCYMYSSALSPDHPRPSGIWKGYLARWDILPRGPRCSGTAFLQFSPLALNLSYFDDMIWHACKLLSSHQTHPWRVLWPIRIGGCLS